MANTIKLKNSGTSSNTPSSLEYGEIAINYADGKLFYKDGGGSISEFANARASVSDTAPSSPSEGDIWFESDTGDVFVYYDSVWVDVGGTSVANIAMSDTAPSSPVNGDFWFETDTGRTFVYYDDGTSQQWIEVGATSAAANGSDGAVQFASGGTFSSDDANLHWDDTNNRLGIGTTTPAEELDVVGDVQVSGRLGIGSGISAELDIKGASNPEIRLQSTDSSDPFLYFGDQVDAVRGGIGMDTSANALQLRGYNNSTRMTIDSSGNVGIGTTIPSAPLHVSSTGAEGLRIQKSNIDQQGSYIGFYDDNARLGYVGYAANDDLYLENEASAGKTFLSTAGAIRMTIDAQGDVGIGANNPTNQFEVYNGTYYSIIGRKDWGLRSTGTYALTTSGGANIYISTNGTFYRSTSSGKYKTDVEDMNTDAADVVFALRPVWFRSTSPHDPESWSYYGLIAEEVAEVDPRLVSFGAREDCGCDADADHVAECLTEPEGVYYDRLVPHLISVTQRQQEQIDALTARIEALEAN